MDKKLVELLNTALSNPSETQILASAISSTLQSAGPRPIAAFLVAFKRTIKNSHVPPSNKLRALHVFCVCMKSASAEFVQAAEKKLINRLLVLGLHKKESEEMARGASLFGKWGQMVEEAEASVEFLSLLLTSLADWADRYIYSRPGELSKFYRTYQRLLTEGVTFPSSFDIATQQERFHRMQEALSRPDSRPDDIAEIRRKLPDIRLQLTQALERETSPASKAQISALLAKVEDALEPKNHDLRNSVHQEPSYLPYFQPLIEPQPLSLPSDLGEILQLPEEIEEKSPFSRTSLQELNEELKAVDLRIECETLKDQNRKLECENRNLRQEMSSLRKEIDSVKRSQRSAIPNFPYMIANKASFQLLTGLEKGTLYCDKYCEVLIKVKLDEDSKTCTGAFMLVVKSGVREVQETVQLQSVAVLGVVCRSTRELNAADFGVKGYADAQYRLRYSELTPSSPLFTLSFVSEGLQFLYHFQVPILMLCFAEPLAVDVEEFAVLWEELKDPSSEAVLPAFDLLIQNTVQLSERMKLGSRFTVLYGGSMPQGTVSAAGSLRGERVLVQAVVLPDRTLVIKAGARNQRMRNFALLSFQQLLETDGAV